MSSPTARNMRLLAQHPLDGFGNCGEGMAIQLTRDKRRVLWIAHESAPKNVTAVDVTNPRKPTVARADRPAPRADALELARPGRATCWSSPTRRRRPASRRPASRSSTWRIRPSRARSRSSTPPARPRAASTICGSSTASTSTWRPAPPTSRRVTARTTSATASWTCGSPPARREVGRWWLPGTRDGDTEPPPPRHPVFDSGYRAHNTNVYPKRPDRAWVGYLDGGAIILDIADKAHPRLVARWDYQPPFPGFCHTLLPLLDRGLLVVSDESVADGAKDWPKLVWIWTSAKRPSPCRSAPARCHRSRPSPGAAGASALTTCTRTVRRRARGSRSNSSSARSSTAACARSTRRTRSIRAEVAWAVPPAPRKSRAKAIQLNDVFVDERQIVYTVDRMIGGLYIYEMKL